MVKFFDQGEISLLGRFQLNDFFQTDVRSPELSIDIIRTPIGDTGFFYDGVTSYGVLDEELDADSILDGLVDPSGYNRFRTYHEFLFPTQLGGFLNVTPRGGLGMQTTQISTFLASVLLTAPHLMQDWMFPSRCRKNLRTS